MNIFILQIIKQKLFYKLLKIYFTNFIKILFYKFYKIILFYKL